jgi:hypothetical protein
MDRWDEARAAIAKVTCTNPDSIGAAFFIGRNHFLSALHVVADVDSDPPLFAGTIVLELPGGFSSSASVVAGYWDVAQDWVLLAADDAPNVKPIEPGELPKKGQAWRAFGFPAANSDGTAIDGEITESNVGFRGGSAIQLFCKQAGAGNGMSLHGLSGSPCVIEGKACGILRATPVEQIPDGKRELRTYTIGGIVFACAAKAVRDAESARLERTLIGAWDPLPNSLRGRDFVVFLSEAESRAGRLKTTVEQADRRVRRLISGPTPVPAADYLQSWENLKEAIQALCHARVVVFDVTGFEPACLFLAGIRSVVRRGVTILSHGGRYTLGGELDVPFNIADVNLIAHSADQAKLRPTPIELLSRRIRRGLQDVNLPHYADLPVYDAIRRIPAEDRGVTPKDEGVIVLCTFDVDYTKSNWDDYVKAALQNELDTMREDRSEPYTQPASLGVVRSFDLVSTRLVSHALYETIRTAESCVIDFSRWSGSVVFEAGVRLAASPKGAAAIIEKNWREKLSDTKRPYIKQYEALFALFEAAEYESDKVDAFSKSYGGSAASPSPGIGSGQVYQYVESVLDVDDEPASRPVYRELIDSAALFASQDLGGGRFKPVGLYPGNRELAKREDAADFDRLVAAWLFLFYTVGEQGILADEPVRQSAKSVIQALLGRHGNRSKRRLSAEAFAALGRLQDAIEQSESRHDR